MTSFDPSSLLTQFVAESKVLVVDRSQTVREMVSRSLRQAIPDISVTGIGSGREAIKQLSVNQYTLVTTALMLEDMDGLELCQHIRQNGLTAYTPVIVISSDADNRLLKEGFEAGVTDYFDKSRGYAAFAQFVRNFIRGNVGLVGRALYVEDSRATAEVTRGFLEKHGFHVTHFTNAEAAFGLLKRIRDGESQISFDIVISDFFLQNEMTGGDLLYAIRARLNYSRQELPVLVLTGKDDTRSQVDVFHAGANDFVNKPLIEEVLIARVRSLLLIKQLYDALQRQTARMENMAVTDSLTSLKNRSYLTRHGETYFRDKANQPVVAVIMDIDFFKNINDTYGHQRGDEVLQALGQCIAVHFRQSLAVRYGGEEFVALIPNTKFSILLKRLDLFRQDVQELKRCDVRFTISIGVSAHQEFPKLSLEQLLEKADNALYHAKENGRNRIIVNTQEGMKHPTELGFS